MANNKRPMIRRCDSSMDRIRAHFLNPELYPLTDKVKDLYDRYNEIFNLRLAHWSTQEIVSKWAEKGISTAQAYLDIRNSESLFGSVLKADVEGTRAMWLEWARDYLKRARAAKDRKAEGTALKLLAEYGRLNAEENPDFNPEKLENKEIHIHLPKGLEKKLEEMLSGGSVDFNDLDVTDIDHEEV